MYPDYVLFATVVDSGSLSAAARTMAISPAMASKRLARLERRLGVRLIQRTTRRLALTHAGAAFHRDVTAILQAVRDAEERLTGVRGLVGGRLRVSAPTSFGRLHVAPHLHLFLADHPLVALELDLSDANVDLVADGIDVAVRIATTIPASLSAHRLAGSRRLLCAAPAYLARNPTPATIASLGRHRLLAATGQLPWRLEKDGRRHTVEGENHVRTNSSEIVRELVMTGVGIALRSLWDVGDALAAGQLVPVLPGWEAPASLGIYAVHPHAPMVPPAVTAFIRFLQRTMAPPPWERDLAPWKSAPDMPVTVRQSA